jgi:hypothetical protein
MWSEFDSEMLFCLETVPSERRSIEMNHRASQNVHT